MRGNDISVFEVLFTGASIDLLIRPFFPASVEEVRYMTAAPRASPGQVHHELARRAASG